MPKSWSNKRERQYEHIKDSAKSRGKSTKRAKEIAARTVNKTRSDKGETKSQQGSSSRGGSSSGKNGSNKRSGSSGNKRGLEDRTRQQLYDRAKKMDIEGRSKMNKQQLVQAIRKAS